MARARATPMKLGGWEALLETSESERHTGRPGPAYLWEDMAGSERRKGDQ